MKIKLTASLIIFLFVFGLTIQAQRVKQTIAPEFSVLLPVGTASQDVGIGFGLNAQAQFPIKRSAFSILARSGLNIFTAKTINIEGFQFNTKSTIDLPFLVGGRYYVSKGLHTDLEFGVLVGISNSAGTAFDFSPSLGYSAGGFDPFVRFSSNFGTGGSFFSFGTRYQFRIR